MGYIQWVINLLYYRPRHLTCACVRVLYVFNMCLSQQVPLGHYPEEHFSERVPRQHMEIFKGELGLLSALIEARNLNLEIPCTFLDPPFLENSVAIWVAELWGAGGSGPGGGLPAEGLGSNSIVHTFFLLCNMNNYYYYYKYLSIFKNLFILNFLELWGTYLIMCAKCLFLWNCWFLQTFNIRHV